MRLLRLVGAGLISLLMVTASSIGCGKEMPPLSPESPMTVTGIVTEYESGATAGGIEVKLFTYHPNPRLEYLPPTGHVIGSDITTEEGKYRIEVGTDLLQKLVELGYDKLVVFVASGVGGWKVIDLAGGTIEVDLVTGAPVPSR